MSICWLIEGMNKYTFPSFRLPSAHPFQEGLWEWVQGKLRFPIERDSRGFAQGTQSSTGCVDSIGSGVLPISTPRYHVTEISPAQDQAACLFLSAWCLATPGYRWEIGIQDGMYVFHKRKSLQVQLNLGNFIDHGVEEENGIPYVSLTLEKCIPSV